MLIFTTTAEGYFYPRSPCGERRPMTSETVWVIIVFLSTLSLRRATQLQGFLLAQGHNFYPRSPCGERPIKGKPASPVISISIHALLAESDANWFDLWGWAEYFYPRSPCGERPLGLPAGQPSTPDFYPRSPCGERP